MRWFINKRFPNFDSWRTVVTFTSNRFLIGRLHNCLQIFHFCLFPPWKLAPSHTWAQHPSKIRGRYDVDTSHWVRRWMAKRRLRRATGGMPSRRLPRRPTHRPATLRAPDGRFSARDRRTFPAFHARAWLSTIGRGSSRECMRFEIIRGNTGSARYYCGEWWACAGKQTLGG